MASNMPGHEQVECLVTDGDAKKLLSDMVDILRVMSDAAYETTKHSYEREHAARSPEDDDAARSPEDGDDVNNKESRPPTNPYKTLMGQLYGWMHQLPVIDFNSGKYDLNGIKQFLIPYVLSTSKTEEEEEHKEKEENDGIG